MRRVVPYVALVVLGLMGCTQIRARDLVREGNAAYKSGKFELAVELYTESLEHEPDGVTVLWNRACAAESLVLSLKDASSPAQQAARKKYTDMALADFKAWGEASEPLSETDAKAVHDHRLALLKSDERCDDLVAYWLERHRENPKDEGLYTIIARTFEDTCQKPDEADKWFVKRTEDFPESEKALYTLAVRRFDPLFPDPESGLQYNDNLDPAARLAAADEVIALLDRASKIRPKYRDPYIWRAMAHTQKQFARVYDELSDDPRDKLQALLAREDSMLAWREQKAVCDIDAIPDCPRPVEVWEATKAPGAFGDRRLSLTGKVRAATISRDPASTDARAVYTFELEGEPAPAPVETTGKRKKPPVAEESAPAPVVQVRFVFEMPAVVSGEAAGEAGEDGGEAAPPTAEAVAEATAAFKEVVNEAVEGWKGDRPVSLNGVFEGGVFVTSDAPLTACCPLAPIAEAEYAADLETRRQLEAKIAEQKAKGGN